MATFTLTKPDGTPMPVSFFGLVDSGADSSLFPMEVMKDLGIDLSDCTKAQGVGANGIGDRYIWNGGKLAADVYGTTVNPIVQFSDTLFILLGREDFFVAFKVGFDQRGLKLSIESY